MNATARLAAIDTWQPVSPAYARFLRRVYGIADALPATALRRIAAETCVDVLTQARDCLAGPVRAACQARIDELIAAGGAPLVAVGMGDAQAVLTEADL